MNSNDVYLFGSNGFAAPISKLANPVGIIDEICNEDFLEGLPVTKLSNIEKAHHIINCVINSRSYEAHQRLKRLGYENVSFIGDWMREHPDTFNNHYMLEAQSGICETMTELISKAHVFEDRESIESFLAIIAFRANLNIKHLEPFRTRIDEQYFEDFITKRNFNIFVDAGAYDGSDTLRFVKTNPNYDQLFLFEPFTENFQRTQKAVSHIKKANVIQQALGKEAGVVNVDGSGMAARITQESNGDQVKRTTLDNHLEPHLGKKILIKMDIEGEEVPALHGAKKLLNNPNVSFAVSAYHLPRDLLDILNVFLNSAVKRKLYFRHYSSGITESVIFAI